MEKYPGGNESGEGTTLEQKREVVRRAMSSARPVLSDFMGCTGYSDQTILEDKDYLESKKDEHDRSSLANGSSSASNDEDAKSMESVLTYILNDRSLFPRGENFSFWACEYDDVKNGTDIVFGVHSKKTGENLTFSVDAATGTNKNNIKHKFETSFDAHDGTSRIKYCLYKNQRWQEPEALHFVVGMSPASQDKALDKIAVEDGELKGREQDLDTDFMVLSEMMEQVDMLLAIYSKRTQYDAVKQRINKLTSIRKLVSYGLFRVLGINPEKYQEDKKQLYAVFNEEYSKKQKKRFAFDDVYKNIIVESRRRKIRAEEQEIGKKTVDSVHPVSDNTDSDKDN